MRKVVLIAVVVLVCGCFAVAQDYPKASIFGGARCSISTLKAPPMPPFRRFLVARAPP